MERMKTIRTREGYAIDLWRDQRTTGTSYAVTVRHLKFEKEIHEPSGGWVPTQKAALNAARDSIEFRVRYHDSP